MSGYANSIRANGLTTSLDAIVARYWGNELTWYIESIKSLTLTITLKFEPPAF